MNLAKKKIYLAADHAGFAHKEALRDWLITQGNEVVDLGPGDFDPEDDFPEFMAKAAKAVQADLENSCAIILGGSGQGEAMAANRFQGIRATVYYGGPDEIIMLSRAHNNANILALGARFLSLDEVKKSAWLWLKAPFGQEEKYVRRNQQLDQF